MNNAAFVALLLSVAACDATVDVPIITAELQAAACTHGACVTGGPLTASCTSCTATVCQSDPYCCSTAWDTICTGEADALCGHVCEGSCGVGSVPIVSFADWDKKLPPALGRQVFVIGPWTSPDLMSITVFQEQSNAAALLVVLARDGGLGQWFTAVVAPNDGIVAGVAPGMGPGPVGPIGPAGGNLIIGAAQEIARQVLHIGDDLVCVPDAFRPVPPCCPPIPPEG